MDCSYLPLLLDKLIDEDYDYAKGNRFFHIKDLRKMPKVRLIGNVFVSFLTKFSTGYWSISDPLNGYTAIKVATWNNLDIEKVAKKYDFEVSMFNVLAMVDAKIADVFIPAIYGDEVSKVKFFRDTYRVSKCLFLGFLRRMFIKKLLFNMSLVPIYYLSGLILTLWGIIFGIYIILSTDAPNIATTGTIMISVIPFILGIQILLQAISLDIQSEPK
jgi:hypothetical protein